MRTQPLRTGLTCVAPPALVPKVPEDSSSVRVILGGSELSQHVSLTLCSPGAPTTGVKTPQLGRPFGTAKAVPSREPFMR